MKNRMNLSTFLMLLMLAWPLVALAGTTSYQYDDLHRLIQVTRPDGTVTSYNYDDFGNRTSKVVNICTNTYYRDADEDSFGDTNVTTVACSQPLGYVTDNTDCNDNNSFIFPGAAEVCDGLDNDCNGTPDDGIVSTPTTCGVGECAAAGETTCVGGVPGDSCSPGTPVAEVCEGSLDENCDGAVDDGCACTNDDIRICGSGTGECQTGTETCQNGQWNGICAGEIGPTGELCDGLDNDCDGVLDGSEGLTQQCGTSDLGVCSFGTESCDDAGNWINCDAVFPATEICGNALDEDCDGSTIYGCEICVDVDLTSGWNLISLPVTPPDPSLSVLFPDAEVAYGFDGTYSQATSLEPGKGYWVKVPSDRTYTICGQDFTGYSSSLNSGWQLMGAVNAMDVLPDTVPPDCISVMYGFDGVYYQATDFDLGQGYWVKMEGDCEFILNVQ